MSSREAAKSVYLQPEPFAPFAAGMKNPSVSGERPLEEAAITNTGRPSPVFMLIYEPSAHSTLRV